MSRNLHRWLNFLHNIRPPVPEGTFSTSVVRFLPKYTLELAPIESQWREVKRYIANQFFDDIGQLKREVLKALRSGRIKIIKMHDYLTA